MATLHKGDNDDDDDGNNNNNNNNNINLTCLNQMLIRATFAVASSRRVLCH